MSAPAGRQLEHGPGAAAKSVARRRFLTYLVAAPVLTVAAERSLSALATPTAAAAIPSPPQPANIIDIGEIVVLATRPTAAIGFQIRVNEDGTVDVSMPREEVGQGLSTVAAMLVAEEMDVPLGKVRISLADARPELLFNQLTGASSGVRSIYHPARATAAAARARLLEVAARRWGVSRDELTVADGVIRARDGRTTTYGDVTKEAARADLPELKVKPKTKNRSRYIGKPAKRVDGRKIVTGTNTYTLDVDVPGAKPCIVRRPPTISGTVRSVRNVGAVKRMPGVVAVTTIPSGVAVVADTFDYALNAVNALDVDWGPGSIDNLSDENVRAKLRAMAPKLDVPEVGVKSIVGEFGFAFATHGAVEMNAAVADVRDGRAEVWAALQAPVVAQEEIARTLGIPMNKVVVHVMPSGGSFGRRLFHEPAVEAALVSKAVGRPVRLLWHRTDDIRHGRVHPAKHHRIQMTYAAGNVVTYQHHVTSVSTDIGHGFGDVLTAKVADIPIAGNASIAQVAFHTMIHCPYNFGVVTETLSEWTLPMHTGSWRSVWSVTTRGVEEVMVDEVAAALGKDPVEFRRRFLKTARQRAVLDKVAEVGQWGKPMPKGCAQGVAVHDESKSCTACLVEVDARDPKHPRVTKAVIAVDPGLAVNPSGVEAQMLGGLTDAISLAFRARLHLVKGRFLEGSFANFHYARQKDSPREVQVIVMPPTTGEPGGVGELGLAAPFGAVVNAYARATGTKPRSFPIFSELDFTPYPPSTLPRPPMQAPPAKP